MNEFHRWCDVEARGRRPLIVFRRERRARGWTGAKEARNEETHQDRMMKDVTLHFYRRNHGSASAVTDVSPCLCQQ